MSTSMFDSLEGMIHYFIRPEDQFALNSLELVDCDEYLYRVLKNSGYERVVFFERTAGIRSFAYDEISNLSITAANRFEAVDMKDPKSVQDFLDSERDNRKDVPMQGKYKVPLGNSKVAMFISNFEEHIARALQAENAKTAIVMPLNIFKGLNKDGANIDGELEKIAGIMENLVKYNHKQENIIVFTMAKKEELLDIYKDKAMRNIHRDFPLVDNIPEIHKRIDTIFQTLKGRITLVDTIGTDEIANLLLRKKTLEPQWKKALEELPYSRIYELANLLREQMIGKKNLFKSIGEVKGKYITTLNNCFTQKKDYFVPELLEKASNLKDQEVFNMSGRDAVCLDRVTHQYSVFTNICLEADVLAEMDNLIGAEMQAAKKQVIEAINQFERERKRFLQAKEEGKSAEMPYMNFCIFGPPGTGKSTIGKYVAKLMNAKRILPTDGFIEVEAATLKGVNVGKTGENILEIAKKANGGVLLIDEFYTFDSPHSTGNGAQEAMDALIAAINLYGDNLCVIIAGYEKKTEKVLSFNEGNDRRFPEKIRLPKYSTDSLMEVFDDLLLHEEVKQLEEGLRDKIKNVIEKEMIKKGEKFGNVGYLKNLLKKLEKAYSEGKRKDNIYHKEDLLQAFPEYSALIEKKQEKVEDILREFERFQGTEMKEVKNNILSIIDDIEGTKMPFMNIRFRGVPRAEKREMAGLVARLLCAKGILPTSEFIDFGENVKNIEKELANGGVLFVDELRSTTDSVNTLLAVAGQYRDMCIIVADYEDKMVKLLKGSGESVRFPYVVDFPDYSTDTLMAELKALIEKENKSLDERAEEAFRAIIEVDRRELGNDSCNVNYLKDEILDKLRNAYIKRGEQDKQYTIADVEVAFPEKMEILYPTKKPVVRSPRIKEESFRNLSMPKGWPEEPDEKSITRAAEGAILYIKTDAGEEGTGFLISEDGYVITCAHVIAGANCIVATINIPDRQVSPTQDIECKVVKVKRDVDMALLQLVKSKNCPYLPLVGSDRQINICEKYVLRGYTFEKTKEVSQYYPGTISVDRALKDDFNIDYYVIDGQATKGSSGSPIISLEDGKVIGILIGAIKSENDYKEEINCMRPIKYFWDEFFN